LGRGETIRICDPWLKRCDVQRDEAREALGLDSERMVFLHLGTTRPEKGLKDACDALLRLDPALLGSACLLRAGRVDKSDFRALESLKDRGAAQLIDRYVEEQELGLCYAAADWVLLPYRNQKESSGVLVHAAANKRPVIASDYGIIGNATKEYSLGHVFAHGSVAALSVVLEHVISNREKVSWPEQGMVEFANLNSPGAFQMTLVENWLRS
jgi:glycosyltransferase involved in cell wall biosynthesis